MTKIIAVLLLITCISISKISHTQNIKFYTDDPSVAVSSIDFDKDSILHMSIKADSALLEFDMLMFSTTISHKKGKRKWGKYNTLMPNTFNGKLQDDGYYHFVAYRKLGNGLSYSEIGLLSEDFRFGKIEMNTSLSGKKRLNDLNTDHNVVANEMNVINTNTGYIQYEADVFDYSLPISVERYSESTKIRTKSIVGTTFAIAGITCLIVSPAIIVAAILTK